MISFKLKTDKHFVHALMYDIFTWSLNVSLMLFIWSVSPYYATIVTGLFLFKFASSYVYRWSITKEQIQLFKEQQARQQEYEIKAKAQLDNFTKALNEEADRKKAIFQEAVNNTIEDDSIDTVKYSQKKDILQ